MSYFSTKRYGPEEGFSIAYRQWRADRKSGKTSGVYSRDEIPGCCALHGYAVGFFIEFECTTLDARNWVVDFGSLRSFKNFLKENFDHTMLVAEDDPEFTTLENLHKMGLAKMVVVEATGCEALGKYLYDYLNEIWLPENYPKNGEHEVRCRKVEVYETPANSGGYEG